jgi:HSP20 family protein
MTLVRFNPMRGLEKAQRRFNSFMDDMEKGVSFEMGGFNPRVDITEDDKNLYVHAEMPGIPKDNVKISVNDDMMLTIKGSKNKEELKEEQSYVRAERAYGEFSRSFVLPENIDIDNINAKYENGVLELTLPKVEPPKPKEVEVKID